MSSATTSTIVLGERQPSTSSRGLNTRTSGSPAGVAPARIPGVAPRQRRSAPARETAGLPRRRRDNTAARTRPRDPANWPRRPCAQLSRSRRSGAALQPESFLTWESSLVICCACRCSRVLRPRRRAAYAAAAQEPPAVGRVFRPAVSGRRGRAQDGAVRGAMARAASARTRARAARHFDKPPPCWPKPAAPTDACHPSATARRSRRARSRRLTARLTATASMRVFSATSRADKPGIAAQHGDHAPLGDRELEPLFVRGRDRVARDVGEHRQPIRQEDSSSIVGEAKRIPPCRAARMVASVTIRGVTAPAAQGRWGAPGTRASASPQAGCGFARIRNAAAPRRTTRRAARRRRARA